MLVKKIVKTAFMVIVVIVMTACSGNGGSDNTAIDKLIAYATTGEPVPTAQDYADAGVVGVTDANVASVNAFILGLLEEQVDTKEEVQALADEAGVSLSPRAVIVVNRNFAPKGGSISFTGSNSIDLDGTIVNYVWTRDGQVISNSITFSTTSLPYGSHIITLTVTDDDGNVGQATVKVRIEDINESPVADAGPNQTIVLPGTSSTVQTDARFNIYYIRADQSTQVSKTVKLDGRASSDDGIGGSTLTYEWEVIQGNATLSYADSATPSFVVGCNDIGVIIIRLTVSDGTSTATDTVRIQVVDSNNVCIQPT